MYAVMMANTDDDYIVAIDAAFCVQTLDDAIEQAAICQDYEAEYPCGNVFTVVEL